MSLFEKDMVLYTMWQKVNESPAKFMQIFKAQVNTIYAHGGKARYRPKIYKDNLTANCKLENVAYEDASTPKNSPG